MDFESFWDEQKYLTLISDKQYHFGQVSFTQDHNQNFTQYWTVNIFNSNGCFYTLNMHLCSAITSRQIHIVLAFTEWQTNTDTHGRCDKIICHLELHVSIICDR